MIRVRPETYVLVNNTTFKNMCVCVYGFVKCAMFIHATASRIKSQPLTKYICVKAYTIQCIYVVYSCFSECIIIVWLKRVVNLHILLIGYEYYGIDNKNRI